MKGIMGTEVVFLYCIAFSAFYNIFFYLKT